jgi:DNA-binding FadR family transcriptional regulator
MEIKRPVRLSLSAQVLAEIEKLIITGQWQVGEKIPGELELMHHFGISRNTLREAMQSLVFAGILQSKQGDGTYIVSRNQFDASMTKKLQNADLLEILETRAVLETQIVRLVALRRTTADIEELAAYLEQRNRSYSDKEREAFISADTSFHLHIAYMCGNSLLYDLYQSLFLFLEQLVRTYLEYSYYDVQSPQHNQLFEAIKAQDSEAAAQVVYNLVEQEKETFIKAGLIKT